MPTDSTPWTTRVWREFHAGNLTRAGRDVLLTLRSYRGRGGLICPSHETLAGRVDCHPSTVWRALHAARELGLVQWAERRVRALWRSLRTSNAYVLTVPEKPVAPGVRTDRQKAGGGEKRIQKEGSGSSVAAVNAMLQAASRLPDLLATRRTIMEGRLMMGAMR